jgi:hypothetical protein
MYGATMKTKSRVGTNVIVALGLPSILFLRHQPFSKPAKAGDSIEPGVKRSGTPGILRGRAREVGGSGCLTAFSSCE